MLRRVLWERPSKSERRSVESERSVTWVRRRGSSGAARAFSVGAGRGDGGRVSSSAADFHGSAAGTDGRKEAQPTKTSAAPHLAERMLVTRAPPPAVEQHTPTAEAHGLGQVP